MKKDIFYLVFLFLAFQGCSSGKGALEKGDYADAVLTAVSRLRQNPNNKRAQETLVRAYPRFIDYNLDRANRLRIGGDAYRWERILELFLQMNQVYDEILRAPGANEVIPEPRSFEREYEDARIQAAEARYALGQQALNTARQGDRMAAKEAYRHFERTDVLYPGFREAEELMREARELAIVHVLVEPIPMASRILDISNEFFQNQILEYVKTTTLSPFVLFYTPEEAGTAGKQPDHVIRMAFDDFVVGQAYVQETIEDRTRDSVVVGKVDVVENGQKVEKNVYGTVKAKVHIFKKAIDSNGQIDLRIIDQRAGGLLSQRKFSGGYTWFDFWGYFNGDERALTDEDKRRLRYNREVMPPPPQDLFIEFTKPIYQDVTKYIRNFYNSY